MATELIVLNTKNGIRKTRAYGSSFQHPGQTINFDWTRIDFLNFKTTFSFTDQL